ncbi:hypothetical protein DTO013E5_5071 [Penicillium roqueforti]|uniref:Genomic scaffold, ProqFM164S03 n=1 Tax=Penicillium roqueforti (strain FM164) TaxID=1365484 RepID=W6QEV1_PENRF|nr:uncharacterized protein LCP9604111_5679 [Penicillium roqueforti]CDM34581.1 unnamed protein product [Penicillium roqueforti FM164]KAF9247970.1 hypothetical protein LCP9604111_5679 [Penicillium roqueforti]KAI1834377.1 hypothetical protein CBS147337_4667 [Penicillium roqueforti]KAI2692319.1 hypothetical protein LCP963914a_413 [Penicillium roqueforti]KAI2705284.1 hypothetical protein CBS147372_1587 [Penicillium roqueforti]
MPTSNASNTSSPVKRPGLGRRAVSSHAVVTRSANPNDLSVSHTQKAPLHHKPHRTHVVGAHRNHHRNPSTGKNFNKLQRLQVAAPETGGRHHQRKKSAPATPIASPKESGHVRWDPVVNDHTTDPSMKRNFSTPVLRRNPSAVGKKALVTERPPSSALKKKSVGFELGDDETDDAEWEDTTQSPESTRRNSVAPSNPSADNSTVLVDHLTFVKRPYPQMPRATSLPESITTKFVRERTELHEDEVADEEAEQHDEEEEAEESSQHTEQGDIAARLLSPTHSSKAPPAMSSISAMVKPEANSLNTPSRSSASLNLAAGQDNARRTLSSTSMASMPGSQPQATSSSMEGGVSRFILDNKNSVEESSRNDSDPNTPSSFLPHYHPDTPPSPTSAAAKMIASPARPRGADLPSRTQQKLWLQRTATLNNSPPDNHGVTAAVPPSTIDPTFIAANHSTYDAARGLNGDGRAGGAGHDSETRHIRKAYEKTSLELMVVRRFQSPTGQSFARLRHIVRAKKAEQGSALIKAVQSAPSLSLLQQSKQPTRLSTSPTSKSQPRNPTRTASEDPATNNEHPNTTNATKANDPSHRIFSTSTEASRGPNGDNDEGFELNDSAMLIRRMWESREVAIHG